MCGENAQIFPPIVVFEDDDGRLVVADGFHRVRAAQQNGQMDIVAEIHRGSRLEALRYSLGANNAHGLRRTNADKRRSVELALSEETLRGYTDNYIAGLCGVGNHLVAEVRLGLGTNDGSQVGDSPTSTLPVKRTGGDGKLYSSAKRRSKNIKPPDSNPAEQREHRSGQSLDVAENTPFLDKSPDQDADGLRDHAPSGASSKGERGENVTVPDQDGVDAGCPVPDLGIPASRPSSRSDQQVEIRIDDEPHTTNVIWDDGILSLERVRERLVATEKMTPFSSYTPEQLAAFKDSFIILASTTNRLAREICAARSVSKKIAVEAAAALGNFIRSSPPFSD